MEREVDKLNTDIQHMTNNRKKPGAFAGLIPPNKAEMITGIDYNTNNILKEHTFVYKCGVFCNWVSSKSV